MKKSSAEQQKIINAGLHPLYVTACAGSGKTLTAVRRVAKVRAEMGGDRGYVALLSFSNVAVETFKKDYAEFIKKSGYTTSERVVIETIDGFITQNILKPHGHLAMGCDVTPFLVTGNEPFLNNDKFKFWTLREDGTKYPVPASDIGDVSYQKHEGKWQFIYKTKNGFSPVTNGDKVSKELAKTGAYTFNLGKLWAIKVLKEKSSFTEIIARRYPQLIVDEAQDLEDLHQILLEKLSKAGAIISLIGDSAQAIYEFIGADGKFLQLKSEQSSQLHFSLTKNYRSIQAIQSLASQLSKRSDVAERNNSNPACGLFYLPFSKKDRLGFIDAFVKYAEHCELDIDNSAILCRNSTQIRELLNTKSTYGVGKVVLLAKATVKRDLNHDYFQAYKLVCSCLIGFFSKTPPNLLELLSTPDEKSKYRKLKLEIWKFVKCHETGLPSGLLRAEDEWHPLVKERFQKLLEVAAKELGFEVDGNIGRRLAKTKLTDAPLVEDGIPSGSSQAMPIRIDTVHQAKGQSLDAVLYQAKKDHIKEMFGGVASEAGRIGYVALTRAKDLFVLGVPASALKELQPILQKHNFRELPSVDTA